MPEVEIVLPELHPAQQTIVENRRAYNVLPCGRRFGKTEILKDRIGEFLLDGKFVGLFYPQNRTGGELWRWTVNTFEAMTKDKHEGNKRIELINGGILEQWSLKPTTAHSSRGRKYHLALIDEAAYVPTRTYWDEVIQPMQADYYGRAEAWFASSAWGKNWFWELHNQGMDPNQKEWKTHLRPEPNEFGYWYYTLLDNPYIPSEALYAAENGNPRNSFLQEYLCVFLDDAAAIFQGVKAISILQRADRPIPFHRHIAGVDFGRDMDWTVVYVIDTDTGHVVDQIRIQHRTWNLILDEIIALYEKWDFDALWAETNNAGMQIETLEEAGVPVERFLTSSRTKGPLIDNLTLAIERSAKALQEETDPELLLLDDENALLELQSYTYEKLPGGGIRYTHPPNMHDDEVMALALAWWGCTQGGMAVSMQQAQVRQSLRHSRR